MPNLPAPTGRTSAAEGPRRADTSYDPEVAEAICELVVQGYRLDTICRRRSMPARTTVDRWLKRRADFAQALGLALQVGGGRHRSGQPTDYSLGLAAEICRRLGEGESMVRICADPDMPCTSVIYRWLNKHPEFVAMYSNAREIQAERYCDEVTEIADAATPETLAVDKARIAARQWRAAILVPRKYGTRIAAEHPDAVVFNVEIVKFSEDQAAEPVASQGLSKALDRLP